MGQKIKYIGMAWYHRKDYKKLQSIFTDGHVLPDTFDEWLQLAEDGFNGLTKNGVTVEKVYIDPDTFPAWCLARGLDIDRDARMKFADSFVARKYLGTNA